MPQSHANIQFFAERDEYGTDPVKSSDVELNIKAAEKMANIHDALKSHGYLGHQLEVYLVRLLFCMFADSTGIFEQNGFLRYIEQSKPDGSDLSPRLASLFRVLGAPEKRRAKLSLLPNELKSFQYASGDLFKDRVMTAKFDSKMRTLLIDSTRFDWSGISPAIFGAMFQSVMDQNRRRELGAHYTSEGNILKVIRPLFLDELWSEFDILKSDPHALDGFHGKLRGLKFLDPACGCGNFLITTYRQLRLLEIEVLRLKARSGVLEIDFGELPRVGVNQFYGIELEEFACQIAQVGMFITAHLMNIRVSQVFGYCSPKPALAQAATIVCGNALRIDWSDVVPKNELSYIMGNPPFLGYSLQSSEQKVDIRSVYVDRARKPLRGSGKIDYVAAWYYKAAQYLAGTRIRAAFVSTNSITQGEQVATVWKPLFDLFAIHIDFAYRTFQWSSDSKRQAGVHCVIVGFSTVSGGSRAIFDGITRIDAENVSPYLVAGDTVFIDNRSKPICDVPGMITGNRPTDGGHLIIEACDYEAFVNADPVSKTYIRPFLTAQEFINNEKRYCLWLVGVDSFQLHKMPEVMKRIAACRESRLSSPDAGRRLLVITLELFRE